MLVFRVQEYSFDHSESRSITLRLTEEGGSRIDARLKQGVERLDILTSPISQENTRLNFQITTKL